jgi:serine phosphatase RsbU (regulator of sigma subunit)
MNATEAKTEAETEAKTETQAETTLAARHWPADGRTGAGGDLLAVRETPYGTRVLIGDARGKGPGAARTAAVILRAFRAAAGQAPTLHDLVRRLDYALQHELAHRTGPGAMEDFATLLAAQIGPDGRTVQLLNLGHPAPLLLHCGLVRPLHPARRLPPLGLGDPAGHARATDTVRLPSDATLLFLTDGVTEARDRNGVFYDPVARLTGRRLGTPHDLILSLFDDVRRHAGGPPADDIALLAVHREAEREATVEMPLPASPMSRPARLLWWRTGGAPATATETRRLRPPAA